MARPGIRIALLTTALLLSGAVHAGQDIVGWVEKVRLYPGELSVKAKIDSGAKTSSLNCTCQQPFTRDGEQWLRFTIVDHEGNSQNFEKKIQRIAKVKRHFGKLQERPVINMEICLAGHRKTIEVNVIDREGLNYQMLIGRSALAGEFLIDPARSFISKPACD